MKLLALFACLISLNSFAATKIQKAFDGGAAKCLEEVDVGTRAYSLEVASEKIIGNQRNITLNVLFYKCDEVVSGYGFRASSATEVLHSFILLPNGKIGQTNNTLVSAAFVAQDADGVILSQDLVKEKDGKFIVNLSINTNVKKAFIGGVLTNDISSELGTLSGVETRYGGFVLNF